MFFKDFLTKIKERNQKRLVIRELISNLLIDETQKNLYLESLELLEDTLLDAFYEKLQILVGGIEQNILSVEYTKNSNTLKEIKEKEKEDRTKEFGNYNILLDNI